MGMKVWEMPFRLGTPGHKGWVLPRGLEVEGQNMCVLLHRLGGPVDQKSKGMWGPSASEAGFGALGG
jgi:hypothetical protein